MFDLLIIGEINPDIILRGTDVVPVFGQVEKMVEAADLTIGSSSVITACGAARLGLKVAFVGVVGDDLYGRFMLNAMQERGIDASHCLIDPPCKPASPSSWQNRMVTERCLPMRVRFRL